jgi:phosphate-selective porin OprO/OprP
LEEEGFAMLGKTGLKFLTLLLYGLAGATVLGVGTASAQESELDALRKRIEKLEQLNQELMRNHASATPSAAEQADGLDKQSVEKIVGEYLKAQETAKKKADDAKKKEAEEKGYEVGTDLGMTASWKNGLYFQTKNKDFTFHPGGRVQADWAWFAPDSDLEPRGWNDGAFFRRIRLRADGTAWEVVNWQVELDLANTSPTVKDTFMEIAKLPYVGNFRAGHFYEPFSLENWGTSDNWITFIERATVIDALDPERNIGMLFHRTAFDERVFWAAGLYRPNSAEGNGFADDSGDGEYSYTTRLTFNPWYENDGRCWLHFGGAYSYRSTLQAAPGTVTNPTGDDVRFRSRIPLRTRGTTFVNSERVIDTGSVLADNVQLYNLQAAMAVGPFSLQGEVLAAQVDDWVRGPLRRDPNFWGCYVLASYFLTGEHRPYLRKIGGIGMPAPHEPFFLVDSGEDDGRRVHFGRGAWELVARYGFVDLGHEDINAIGAIPPTSTFQGHLHDVTLGVNWYLNPNFRIMWNYVYSHVNGLGVSPTTRDGDVHAFGMRFSFWF